MVKLAGILFECMDKYSGADMTQCLIGMEVGMPEESLSRMIKSTMQELGCESLGMNEIVSIGVGDWRRNDIAKTLIKQLPDIPLREVDDHILNWYDSIMDKKYKVYTKAAASKLTNLGFSQ